MFLQVIFKTFAPLSSDVVTILVGQNCCEEIFGLEFSIRYKHSVSLRIGCRVNIQLLMSTEPEIMYDSELKL